MFGGMGMELTLQSLDAGIWGEVVAVNTAEPLKRRLHDFGLVPGTRVRWCYRSPGGDVTALELRGSTLALRTRDLEHIRVQVAW